ncbi:MAG: L,D-transpeptidase, partial [Myxococcales bacterium]
LAALSLTSCPYHAQIDPNHRGDSVTVTSASQSAQSEESSNGDRASESTPRDTQLTSLPVHGSVPEGSDEGESQATANEGESQATAANEGESQRPASNEREQAVDSSFEGEPTFVYSIGRETWIFAEPRFSAKKIGYLRFGARVQRTTEAASRRGCSAGWYGIKPNGYVCANGRTATLDPKHPLATVRVETPDRMADLPFAYTIARRQIPRFYGFAPATGEGRTHSFSKRLHSELGRLAIAALPDWFRKPRQIFGYQRPMDRAFLGDGLAGGGVALLGFFLDAGTLYGMTPDLELVTTDGLDAVRPSSFSGKILSEGDSLPVAFTMSRGAWLYRGTPQAGSLRAERALARREAVALTGERVTEGVREWIRTKDGAWLSTSGLRVVESRTDWPDWALAGEVWIDVSIQKQTLVAYEGKRPMFATLVSTGVDGLMDPATSKSTKTGVFQIVSKHLTATMNGEEPDGAYEMREVPWVQYFSEGYALHGAYWHDGFGEPRSHGCVNLSPIDARWLFHFTHPGLPKDWHGTLPIEPSARVYVHP